MMFSSEKLDKLQKIFTQPLRHPTKVKKAAILRDLHKKVNEFQYVEAYMQMVAKLSAFKHDFHKPKTVDFF